MSWNYESIHRYIAKKNIDLDKLTKEELVQRINDLEIAIYPIQYVLSTILDNDFNTIDISSMLIPYNYEGDICYLSEDKEWIDEDISKTPVENLHKRKYLLAGCIDVTHQTDKLHDDFEVFSIVGYQRPHGYEGGSITMKECRNITKVLNAKL